MTLMMLISMTLMLFMLLILFTIMMMINSKMKFNKNKSPSFECGFDPFNKSRIPLSLHFYFITIIFLIFDIEISIILPMILNSKISNMINFNLMFLTFFIFIMLIIFYEWQFGSLN